MRGGQAPTPGVSSRRSACDRCRGQKLRCPGEGADADGRCDRCAKADAQCVISPVYHMRNYFVGDATTAVAPTTPSHKRRCRADPDQTTASVAPRQEPQSWRRQQQQSGRPPVQMPAGAEPASTTFDWPVDPFERVAEPPVPLSFNPPSWSSLADPVVAGPLSGATSVPSAGAGNLTPEHIPLDDGVNTPSSSGPPQTQQKQQQQQPNEAQRGVGGEP
ncbi:Pyrimidine pathway regulatory protein 1 [Madurella mycetomatis]|uniref:Pyrimidine pathway regulatory protein 1 n=1 Tax=Madurella mycetomatis TaxID=100816 RepID=A0A175W698_9PEZI|nr:Pyrimidine pathway regulatory protein 1 [Madurella mycetomatis]